MNSKIMEIDKLEAAGLRLSDTICGFFAGDHPLTTISSAKAVSILLEEMHIYFRSKGFLQSTTLASTERHNDPRIKQTNYFLRRVANYTKHAKNDASKRVQIQPWQAILSLYSASLDYKNMCDDLIGEGVAVADHCILIETGWGTGTRSFLLADLYWEFVQAIIQDLQLRRLYVLDDADADKGLEDTLDITDDLKDVFAKQLLENNLRTYNPEFEEIALSDAQPQEALVFDPFA